MTMLFRVSRSVESKPQPRRTGAGSPLQTAAVCAHYCYCYYVMYLYALSGNRSWGTKSLARVGGAGAGE